MNIEIQKLLIFYGISEWSGENIKNKNIVVFNEQGIGTQYNSQNM